MEKPPDVGLEIVTFFLTYLEAFLTVARTYSRDVLEEFVREVETRVAEITRESRPRGE